ncbi:MAG: small multi-drug export protein [Solobacterium sp.]|nr:small multi-drug export protein [Solobacterium sp.]
MNSFIQWFMSTIGQHISPELSVFIVSMLPLIEERGGLVLAKLLGLPMWRAVLICVIGNIIPIPFILLLIKKIIHWMADHHLSRVAVWLEEKAAKNKPKIDKYGFWGLTLFVGIPLPGTGAWTGSLVAALFDMDLKRASISILIGVFLAAVIMTLFSYGLIGSLIG